MKGIPPFVLENLRVFFSERSPSEELVVFSPMGGGCINPAGKLQTSAGGYFIKWNSGSRYPGMFEAEAKGLLLLAATEEIHIPQVVLTRTGQEFQFIVLEFIQQNGKAKSFWQDMGRQLAAVHRHTQEDFGLDYDNFIGALPQRNAQRKNWVDFFVENRLQVQLELACTRRIAATADLQQFEKLFKKLPDLFPAEAPALLHGDLWSGNLIADETGMPCLVDPAVYFGNREAELAFTRLFGGFSHDFYDSYRAAFPLIPGFEERVDLYNLYPLLVHTNLFGGNYWAEVRQILNRYA